MSARSSRPASRGELRSALRRADFHRVTRHGRRVDTDYFLVFRLDRPEGDAVRLGITVTRKVGKAVRRNRIKRVVREWFRARQQELKPCDLVVVAKRDLPERLSQPAAAADLDRGLGLESGPQGSPSG